VGVGVGVGVGEVSMKALRRAGELSVRVRRAVGYWQKDGGTDINTDSGRSSIVGDRGNVGLRGDARRGAVVGGVGGRG
jgi:hypothetical protein